MNATSTTSTTSPMIEPHEPHWVSKAAFPVVMTIFYITQIALGFAVYHELYWLAVPLVLVSSHLMHGALIGLHEASHGLLRKKRLLNEIDGILIAAFSFMSFSLYRVVHQSHHAHLATERDEELWPFVNPGISRRAQNSCRSSRTRSRALVHAISFRAGVSAARIDHSQKGPAPAHLARALAGRWASGLLSWGRLHGGAAGSISFGCIWRLRGWPQTCRACENISNTSGLLGPP